MGPVLPEDRTGGGDGLQRNVSPQSTISCLSAMKHYVSSASVLSASPQEDEPSFAQSNCQTQIGHGAARQYLGIRWPVIQTVKPKLFEVIF